MSRLRAFSWALALAMATPACSGDQSMVVGAPGANHGIDQRLGGVWQLTGYVPEQDLPPTLTMELQDKIMVRFEDGMVRSATSSLDFTRRYRISDANGDSFKMFIEDKAGIEVESRCRFDENGDIVFETVTEPWRGRGTLARDEAGKEKDPLELFPPAP